MVSLFGQLDDRAIISHRLERIIHRRSYLGESRHRATECRGGVISAEFEGRTTAALFLFDGGPAWVERDGSEGSDRNAGLGGCGII